MIVMYRFQRHPRLLQAIAKRGLRHYRARLARSFLSSDLGLVNYSHARLDVSHRFLRELLMKERWQTPGEDQRIGVVATGNLA
jgi:hypothetical protein